MGSYFWVAVGSAVGGMARFWLSGMAASRIGETFPLGTLIINVLGSLVIGFFATITEPGGRIFAGPLARQSVTIGFCGGFTAFSSFSLQTLNPANAGEWLYAGLYIRSSLALCLLAVWVGHLTAVRDSSMPCPKIPQARSSGALRDALARPAATRSPNLDRT